MPLNFPLLETPRLILKELNPSNVKSLFTQKDDAFLFHFFSCKDESELEEFRMRYWKSYTDNARFSFKLWLILDKETKNVIGDCGFRVWHLTHYRGQIGYALKQEEFKRKGIMTEVLKVLIPFGFEQMELQKIEAFVGPGNTPSLRLMQKFGFKREGLMQEDYYWKGAVYDSIAFGLLKTTFESNQETTISGLTHLVQSFENHTLPKKDWDHQAHLSVALWYLKKFDKETALCKLRSGIITYNVAVGTANTTESGYHETLTLFWVEVLEAFLKSVEDTEKCVEACCEILMDSPYADKQLPLKYYSKDCLMSVKARSRWVEPDLLVFNSNNIIRNLVVRPT